MSIGERIKAARKKEGLTQEQLAIACNVATITIRQYETNKREPRFEQLKNIARVLKVDWTDLAGDDPAITGIVANHIREKLNGTDVDNPEQTPRTTKGSVTDEDLKFALFGGRGEITDEMYEEVKNFAAFVLQREEAKKKPPQD